MTIGGSGKEKMMYSARIFDANRDGLLDWGEMVEFFGLFFKFVVGVDEGSCLKMAERMVGKVVEIGGGRKSVPVEFFAGLD